MGLVCGVRAGPSAMLDSMSHRPYPNAELIIAEMWQDGECIARWTDQDGPVGLADRLPLLRERGWTVHDFREAARRQAFSVAGTP